MKIKAFKVLAIFFAVGLFMVTSCKKDVTSSPDSQSAEDDARGAYISAESFAMGNDEANDVGGGKAVNDTCWTREFVGDWQGGTITFVFDSCEYRGAIRKGTVKIVFTRVSSIHRRAVNTTITFDNYYVDGVKVEGTLTSTIKGDSIAPSFTVVGKDMKLTFADGKTAKWNATRTFTMVEGFITPNRDDNVIEMSGNVTGTNRKGIDFTSVQDKVRKEKTCKWPVSGTNTITSDNGVTVIDYGNGECDNVITITRNGVSVDINLN